MTEATTDESAMIAVHLEPGDLIALDGWVATRQSPLSRAEAIALIVQEELSRFNPSTTTIRGEFD